MHRGVYVATEVLAPAAFKVPRYELAGLTLLGITWSLGFIWMYARLYAYNRGALGAFIALMTKIAWCVFAIHFAFQGGASIANPNTEDGRGDALGFLASVMIVVGALFVIEGLTCERPSLRDK